MRFPHWGGMGIAIAMGVPDNPKLFHITHVDNLPSILQAGCLWSDAKRIDLGFDCEVVGMSSIKARRLQELPVKSHPGTKVGEYVPFYFCSRSVMLYILHMGNHPDLSYHGGQAPVLHLMADLKATVAWAEAHGCRWSFSSSNAGAYYTSFYADLGDLEKVNWGAVEATDFRRPEIRDGKQAEFLLYERFPWELVEEIGVFDLSTAEKVRAAIRSASHRPAVRVERAWYF
jgi:hypothetical protein